MTTTRRLRHRRAGSGHRASGVGGFLVKPRRLVASLPWGSAPTAPDPVPPGAASDEPKALPPFEHTAG